jgi:hypothetical protein
MRLSHSGRLLCDGCVVVVVGFCVVVVLGAVVVVVGFCVVVVLGAVVVVVGFWVVVVLGAVVVVVGAVVVVVGAVVVVVGAVVVVVGAVVVVVGAVVVVVGAVVVVVGAAVVVVVAGAWIWNSLSTVGLVAVGVQFAVTALPPSVASAVIDDGAPRVRVWPPVPAAIVLCTMTLGSTAVFDGTPAPVNVSTRLLPEIAADPVRFAGVEPFTKSTVMLEGMACAGIGVVITMELMLTVNESTGGDGAMVRSPAAPAMIGSGLAEVVIGAVAPAVMPRFVAHDRSSVTVRGAAPAAGL